MSYAAAMVGAPTLAHAIGHPLRIAILGTVSDRRMTKSDLATELNVPLRHLAYHVRKLIELGLLLEDGAAIRSGRIERAYVLDADAVDEGQDDIHVLLRPPLR